MAKGTVRRALGRYLSHNGDPEINEAAQKLREVIDGFANPVGSTPEGTAWCLKALHPSDPLTMVSGVPDETSFVSAGLNYQQTVDIAAPSGLGAASTWDCTVLFMNDPTCFGNIMTVPTAGGTATNYCVYNKALGGNVGQAKTTFLADFTQWRGMYAGLSVHLSAPAVSDQGVVTAAQYPYTAMEMGSQTAPSAIGSNYTSKSPVVRFDQTAVIPDYNALIGMPNAYCGNARDGVYMPLRLDGNHVKWHTNNDTRYDASSWAVVPSTSSLTTPVSAVGAGFWPYTDTNGLYFSTKWYGDEHLLPCSNVFGGMVFKGLSASATLNFVYRVGFEATCLPTSPFVSFLKVSPEHDLMAITNYYKISRQLKDAYPVAYNDLGKLWDVIKGAARVISPVLSVVPGGSMIRAAGNVLGKLGDAAFGSKKVADAAVSAADLERAQESVKKAIVRQQPKVQAAKLKVQRPKK